MTDQPFDERRAQGEPGAQDQPFDELRAQGGPGTQDGPGTHQERSASVAELAALLPAPPADRPLLVAVNGPSSSGKSTLTGRLAAVLPRAGVVHTDDLAWHHGVLSWDGLLVDGVLTPVRAGQAVSFRPPQWEARGRPGAVQVPAGITHLLVEGVGVGRASLHEAFDVHLWVATPREVRRARDEVRLAAGEMSPADYDAWMAEEEAHLAADRPWERADVVVAGDGTSPDGKLRLRVRPRG